MPGVRCLRCAHCKEVSWVRKFLKQFQVYQHRESDYFLLLISHGYVPINSKIRIFLLKFPMADLHSHCWHYMTYTICPFYFYFCFIALFDILLFSSRVKGNSPRSSSGSITMDQIVSPWRWPLFTFIWVAVYLSVLYEWQSTRLFYISCSLPSVHMSGSLPACLYEWQSTFCLLLFRAALFLILLTMKCAWTLFSFIDIFCDQPLPTTCPLFLLLRY